MASKDNPTKGNPNPSPATRFTSTNQPAYKGQDKRIGKPNLKTLIEKVWYAADPKDVDESGDPRIAGLKVVKALLDKASDGDVAAFKALAERMEGMPTQRNELSGRDGAPMSIQVVDFSTVIGSKKSTDVDTPVEDGDNE